MRKLLVANRSEIAIRVFRSAHELGIRTVAIYSHEDRFALHRFKADEAYEIGTPGEPIRSYLNVDAVVARAKEVGADAIHPGYGFLSENPALARACSEAEIGFVGPRAEVLKQLGDKVAARRLAADAGVPVLGGSAGAVKTPAEAKAIAKKLGYPVIVKAAMGGGGRGMRVVLAPAKLEEALQQAQREAGAAFGVRDVFIEKFVARARHIEVQLLGDAHGGLTHLFERDCSVQRRHQKVVEIAPAPGLDPAVRRAMLEAALAVGRAVRLDNAGTVEFLLDADSNQFYFIEVNPRIQVEHTVTEAVTGHDIVRAQLLVAQGKPLSDPDIGLSEAPAPRGYAIQCRVTTEDPANNFTPDYGRLSHYRSAGGPGIRLDAGTAFSGAVITPYYDSLLVKVTAVGLRFEDAARRMERCLQEFRVRGVKTNIPFLLNLITHPKFLEGGVTTTFIDNTPELFRHSTRQDRATKLLTFLGELIVNGGASAGAQVMVNATIKPPHSREAGTLPPGTRDKLHEFGPERFAAWLRAEKKLWITDTTMRDAHQSLLATRMRTFDMLPIAPYYAQRLAGFFSLEMWGGATFDTSYRFLKESPWDRLTRLRERVPNVLFQMLLRAASAVGYTNYPDNVVKAFVRESANAGIDLFRVFDALNYVPNLKLAIEAVAATGKLCEAAVCYTGDILDSRRAKYDLKYYVELAKQLEKLGAHILAIKDMAGLCKPLAAQRLVRALRQEVGLPIHFHTHDCAGGQLASYLLAAEEGVDVVDCAFAPLAGLTSQPSLNSLAEMLRFHDRDPALDFADLQTTADYWEQVRKQYAHFETGMLAPSADVYRHEMPGGQYTNLYQQAQAVGLGDRWPEVVKTYAEVNQLFGDIVKVTPTSKVVGDMALFMVSNDLSADDVLNGPRELSYPESVVEFFEGKLGQPPGGFPKLLQQRVLRGRKPMKGRPGASLPAADFDAITEELEQRHQQMFADREVVSAVLYPKVFAEYVVHRQRFADVSVIPTPAFFHALAPQQEVSIEIEPGKTLIVKYLIVGDAHPDGKRLVFFELNGQPREVLVEDRTLAGAGRAARPKAEVANPKHVAAPMPGLVSQVAVKAGASVTSGQKLLTMEAMKMETTVYAEHAGVIAQILAPAGSHVAGGDLLLTFA